MSDFNSNNQQANKQTPKERLFKYLPYLPWIVVSVLLFLVGAYIKLRYSTPIYSVNGKILVKDKNPYGKSSEKFSNIFMLPDDNSNLNDEMEIIRSRSMAYKVIKSLGLQKQYAIKGKIRTSEAHSSDLPFEWIIEEIKDSSVDTRIVVSPVNNNQFKINEGSETYNYAQSVQLRNIRFRLLPIGEQQSQPQTSYILSWLAEDKLAARLSAMIGVARSEGASVLNLSYPVENKKIGLDLVNSYMKEYQQASLESKKQMAFNTAIFINEQLDTIQRELGGVEKNLQTFREQNDIFDKEGQTGLFFSEMGDVNKQVTDQGVKLKIVEYLIRYLSDNNSANNTRRTVPSNLGIEEPSLAEQITVYNKLQLEKETLLKTTKSENSMVKRMDAAIEEVRLNILQNLNNIRQAYSLSIQELNNQVKRADVSIRSIPRKEKALLEVTRRQTILQELYSFLLQKKIETAISSASTISDITILEPASVRGVPLSPNRKFTYSLAFLIGLVIPIGIVFLKEYLNDKVQTKQDITRITDAPVLGELGHVENATALVVKENGRNYIAEQFRIIRSNMQYILPKDEVPVILVTSSFSGEGKSFVSTNIGAVMALSGRKTLVMEMDIRKPKILKGLEMHESRGFSNYMIGDINIDELLYPVPAVENLYVFPCGPIPPNPSEMLLDPKVAKLMEQLRLKFDAIIIDSAPIGLVSDSLALGAFANASIYLVRHNYTYKKQIELVDSIYRQKKLPSLSIVINDIKVKGGNYASYGYGYGGYGYGYGYGYAQSKGYYEEETRKKRWKKIFFKS